jgi:hypothetical protein
METTYTVGVVAASMPQGGMNFGDARLGGSSRIASVFVESWNHHRVGTEADRRGRGGIQFGRDGARQDMARSDEFWKPHPCRHGSRSTREVWDAFWRVLVLRGGSMLVSVGSVMVCQVAFGQVKQPSSCRHGAGSTPAAWDAFRQGPVS